MVITDLHRSERGSGLKAGSVDSGHAAKLKKRVKVKQTTVGRGVFARREFGADAVVGEITGEVWGTDYESSYCMDLGGKALLEPSSPFRFLNHCCQPNCQLMLWKYHKVGGRKLPRLWLSTIRDIEAGEELTIDYAWPVSAAVVCLCGADGCRGWVADEQELRRPRRMGLRRGPAG